MNDSTIHEPPQPQKRGLPWGNYFREFLMLFLAVFCGYLAEDFRENHQEKVRAKELAVRFYRELKQDSVILQKALVNRRGKNESLQFLSDSLSQLALTKPSRTFTSHLVKTFYTYSRGSFVPQKVIVEQVRLSGSQIFFQNGNLQQLIGELATSIEMIEARNEIEYVYFKENLRPFMLKHFDAKWLRHIRQKGLIHTANKLDTFTAGRSFVPPRIRNVEQVNIPEIGNMLSYRMEMSYNTMSSQYGGYSVVNAKLLNELRKSYSLKD